MFLLATPGIPKGPPGPPRSGMHEGSTAISLSLSLFPLFLFTAGLLRAISSELKEIKDAVRDPDQLLPRAAFALQCHICISKSPLRTAPRSLQPSWGKGWRKTGGRREGGGGGIQRANIYPPTRRPADPYRKPTLPPVQIKALPGAPSGTLGAAAVTAPAAAPRSVPLRPEPSPQSAPRSLLRSPHPPPKRGWGFLGSVGRTSVSLGYKASIIAPSSPQEDNARKNTLIRRRCPGRIDKRRRKAAKCQRSSSFLSPPCNRIVRKRDLKSQGFLPHYQVPDLTLALNLHFTLWQMLCFLWTEREERRFGIGSYFKSVNIQLEGLQSWKDALHPAIWKPYESPEMLIWLTWSLICYTRLFLNRWWSLNKKWD